MQDKSKNLIIINIASFIMSFSGLFAKWISLESYNIILGRTLVSLPIFLLVCFSFKLIKPFKTKRHLMLICLSGLLMTLHWVLFYKSIQVSNVSVGVIAIFCYPLITSIIEPLVQKKSTNLRVILESIILIGGVFLLSFHSIDGQSIDLGLGLGLIAATAFALRNIIIKEIVEEYSPIWLMMIQTCICVLILFPFGITSVMQAGSKNLLLIAFVGIAITSFGHCLFIQAMKAFSASIVGVISSLQLVYAIGASVILLNEHLSLPMIIGGGILVLVSVYEQIYTFNDKQNFLYNKNDG